MFKCTNLTNSIGNREISAYNEDSLVNQEINLAVGLRVEELLGDEVGPLRFESNKTPHCRMVNEQALEEPF